LNFLITGAGSDIGLALARIIKEEYPNDKLIGIDITEDSPAELVFDSFFVVPKANDIEYIPIIKELILTKHVDIFVPVSEAEIRVLLDSRILEDKFIANKVIILDRHIVDICLDKYKTSEFLELNHIPYPKTLTFDCLDNINLVFPVILKPRSGQGGKGLKVIRNNKEFLSFADTIEKEKYIVQEYLHGDEYTCNVFVSKDIERVIIIKRELDGDGATASGVVVCNKDIESYVSKICHRLSLSGSLNLQLRLTERGPVLFEMNPRFSSTVMFRHKLAYRDFIWTIELKTASTIEPYTVCKSGRRFYKGVYEYVYPE
jgi:carbamoyl-phosphate synthase large subunit